MAAPRKWTDEQQAEAMAIYEQEGVAEASRRTGIPKGTIASVAHRNGMQTVCIANTHEATVAARARNDERREHLRGTLITKAQYAVDRIGDAETPTGCQALATATAILVDKHLLMSGEATSRHETQGSDLDRFIRAKLEEQRKRVVGQRSADSRIIDANAEPAESLS